MIEGRREKGTERREDKYVHEGQIKKEREDGNKKKKEGKTHRKTI